MRPDRMIIAAILAVLSAVPVLGQNEATTAPSPGESKDGTAKMFQAFRDNPKLKQMMIDGQMRELKDVYGDFVKERQLSSQKAEAFYRFLLEESMQEFDDAGEVFENGVESGATPAQPLATQKAEADRQFHMLLGDADHASFEEYQKTTNERLTLSQIRQQFRLNNIPLTDETAKGLLQIMWEERAKTPPTAFDPRGIGSTRDKFRKALEGNNAEQYFETQSDLNKRILSRAGAILNEEQYDALDKFQQRHLEAQKVGVETMRRVLQQADDTVTPLRPP